MGISRFCFFFFLILLRVKVKKSYVALPFARTVLGRVRDGRRKDPSKKGSMLRKRSRTVDSSDDEQEQARGRVASKEEVQWFADAGGLKILTCLLFF
jgi:hypothetical protein